MRDFLIDTFEKLIGLIVIVMIIAVLVGGIALLFTGLPGSAFQGLGVLLVGTLYVVILGGGMYLLLGIYRNTKRTAEAVEKLLEK